MKHKTKPPPDPGEKNPDIPEPLSRLILQLLEKNPAERPQSARNVEKKLEEIDKSLSTATPIPIKKSRGKKSPFKPARIKYAAAAFIVIFAAISVFLIFKPSFFPSSQKSETGAAEWDNSIAVLPFRDLSPDKNQEHISFGMTEALSDRLSRIEQLKVSSPTSVMRYRDTQKDVKIIGQELGVANLVEGSIQVAEGHIRIRGQLTDAATGFTLWTESYEDEMTNIFTLQDEVSQSIAQALELELSLDAIGKTSPRHPENLEAYEAYVRGMNHFASRYMFSGNPSDFETSAEMIEKAVEIDPEYAEAYAGLAWIYTMNFAGLNNPDDKQKADYYAEEAYKLDPESGLVNSLYGTSFYLSGQYDKAYQLLKKSLALNPNQAESQFLCAVFLRQLGLAEPAFIHFQKALELNPFFILAAGASGVCKAMLGEPDNAVFYFDLEKEKNPKLPVLGSMVQYLLGLGREEKAAEYIHYIEKTYPDHRKLPYSRALMLAAQGEKEKALKLSRSTYVFALLQMKQETLDSIEQSIRQSEKSFNFLILKLPVFNFLRDHSRFRKIVTQQKAVYEERLRKYGDL
jgi:serine/threonine-protein kinase